MGFLNNAQLPSCNYKCVFCPCGQNRRENAGSTPSILCSSQAKLHSFHPDRGYHAGSAEMARNSTLNSSFHSILFFLNCFFSQGFRRVRSSFRVFKLCTIIGRIRDSNPSCCDCSQVCHTSRNISPVRVRIGNRAQLTERFNHR